MFRNTLFPIRDVKVVVECETLMNKLESLNIILFSF